MQYQIKSSRSVAELSDWQPTGLALSRILLEHESILPPLKWQQMNRAGQHIDYVTYFHPFNAPEVPHWPTAHLIKQRVVVGFPTTYAEFDSFSPHDEGITQLKSEMQQLRTLRAGWHGENSQPMCPVTVQSADGVIKMLAHFDGPYPHAFPVPEGGVMLEWSLSHGMASIEFDPDSDTATVSLLDARTDEFTYKEDVKVTPVFLTGWLAKIRAVN